MPIYEYQCQSCEHEFETLQKMSDPLLTDCPACHESSLRKKLSAVAFRLKGGGWYETDFKTGEKKNVAGEKSADSAAKDSTSKGGSEKAEVKAESKDSKSSEAKSSDKPSTKAAKPKSPAATPAS